MKDDDPKGEELALKMAKEAGKEQEEDLDLDDGFLDFAEKYRQEFKATVPTGGFGGTTPEVPIRFEDVSLCVDCRFCHAVTIPVNIRIPVGETEQRAALGKIRRCLLGIKLPSDDGIESIASMRKSATPAPLAIDCSHFSPFTDDELADMEMRREQHRARQAARKEATKVLEEGE